MAWMYLVWTWSGPHVFCYLGMLLSLKTFCKKWESFLFFQGYLKFPSVFLSLFFFSHSLRRMRCSSKGLHPVQNRKQVVITKRGKVWECVINGRKTGELWLKQETGAGHRKNAFWKVCWWNKLKLMLRSLVAAQKPIKLFLYIHLSTQKSKYIVWILLAGPGNTDKLKSCTLCSQNEQGYDHQKKPDV